MKIYNMFHSYIREEKELKEQLSNHEIKKQEFSSSIKKAKKQLKTRLDNARKLNSRLDSVIKGKDSYQKILKHHYNKVKNTLHQGETMYTYKHHPDLDWDANNLSEELEIENNIELTESQKEDIREGKEPKIQSKQEYNLLTTKDLKRHMKNKYVNPGLWTSWSGVAVTFAGVGTAFMASGFPPTGRIISFAGGVGIGVLLAYAGGNIQKRPTDEYIPKVKRFYEKNISHAKTADNIIKEIYK